MFWKKLWASIQTELLSRKFRALVVAIMASLTGWLNVAVEPNVALQAIIALIVAYVLGIAAEDGLSKRSRL